MQAVQYPTTTVNSSPPMTTLSPLSPHHFNRPQSDFELTSPVSDKCSFRNEKTYTTTQYYTTLHAPVDRLGMMHADSPREREDGSSHSNSSSSDSESSGGEGEREVGECMVSLSGESAGGTIVSGDGAVKNWTYEDQFKQVSR